MGDKPFTPEQARALLAGLPPLEERALRLRYGIGCTQVPEPEIARRLGVSEEEARALVEAALSKLRE